MVDDASTMTVPLPSTTLISIGSALSPVKGIEVSTSMKNTAVGSVSIFIFNCPCEVTHLKGMGGKKFVDRLGICYFRSSLLLGN